MSSIRPLFIDTDPGCDDMVAILMALQDPKVSVKALSVVAGNTSMDFMASNILRIFEIAGISEQDPLRPKVYKGANEPLLGHRYRRLNRCQYHGFDGLGDQPDLEPKRQDPEVACQIFETDDNNNQITAANAIIEMSHKYAGELELICLAPLTNLAIAYKLDNTLPSRPVL